jgi:mitogen-activated protein kinase 15
VLSNAFSAKLSHHDLKPSNILIRSDCAIRLWVSGSSRMVDPEGSRETLTSFIAALRDRSPEVLFGFSNDGIGIDMFAVGCILADLVNGRPHFDPLGCRFGTKS